MANTLTLVSQLRERGQFQGLFSEMWKVRATIDDTDAVALTDTLEMTVTVPGVVLGDMVVGMSLSLDTNDGTDSAIVRAKVSSADTVQISVTADAGEFAADALNTAVVRVLVGRPTW